MRFFITLNILILVLIVLRKLVKGKVSCKVQYFSWLILPVFMLVASFISIPVAIEKQRDVVEDKTAAAVYNNEAADLSMAAAYPVEREYPHAEALAKNYEVSAADASQVKAAASGSFTINYKTVAVVIWISGSVLFGAIMLLNNISFSRRIRKAREWFSNSQYGDLRVYKLKGLDSPFLLWNKIYIPENLDSNSEHYSLSLYHEYCHYKLGDCFWNVIKNLFLIALWFDPLVWIAYFLIRHDNELAVDEMVIKWNGEDNRVKYGEMLLSYVSNISGHSRISTVATSMSGKSKSFMKKRILNIAKTSTATKYAAVIVSTVLITASVCLLIRPHVVYKEVEVPATEEKASSKETEKEITTTETTPSEPVEESITFKPQSYEQEKAIKDGVVNIHYPDLITGIDYYTDNLIGTEEIKIPEEYNQPNKVHLNCNVINVSEDYMYIWLDGVDYEKDENIRCIFRYEIVDGKQGDLTGSVDIGTSCCNVMDVYEADGKTYAIIEMMTQAGMDPGYAFHIYELDFEKGTVIENREVFVDTVPGRFIQIRYARYSDGTIYVFGEATYHGELEFLYYEVTEDGYTQVEPDSRTESKFWRILSPVFKL